MEHLVEGYHWGKMTSGGWSKAIWALLFPFAMANVAHWMLPPRWLVRGPGVAMLGLCRAVLRLIGIVLSCLLVAQLTVIVMDLLVNQCATGTNRCLGSVSHLGWFFEHPWRRSMIGGLLLLVVIAIINQISTAAWSSNVAVRRPSADSGVAAASSAFYSGDPDVPTLRALHVAASVCTATLLILGGPHPPKSAFRLVLWIIAGIILAFSLLATTVLDDPTDAFGHRWHKQLAIVAGRASSAAMVVLLLLAAWVAPTASTAPYGLAADHNPLPLPGSDDTVGLLMTALALLTLLLSLALILPAAQAWKPHRALGSSYETPHPFRPWAQGWFSAPITALAALLGAGLGVGLSYTASGCLHGSCRPQLVTAPGAGNRLKLPMFYGNVTVLWGLTAILIAAFTVTLILATLIRVLRASVVRYAPGFLLQDSTSGGGRRTVAAAWEIARLKFWGARILTGLALVMAVIGALALQAQWMLTEHAPAYRRPLPHWIGALSNHAVLTEPVRWLRLSSEAVYNDLGNIGVLALDALALGLLYAVYTAARRPNTARQLGILWDLASYWPRSAHPFIPPCYAQKVVPELADRVERYLAQGYRVVLCGHSQGSLLVAAATLRVLGDTAGTDAAQRLGLVTAGSQLQWAYPRGFPSVIDVPSYRMMLQRLDGRWRNLARGTDPLGGAVLSWNLGVTASGEALAACLLTPADSDCVGRLEESDGMTAEHARILGREHWLADPVRPASLSAIGTGTSAYFLGLHRHSDYWKDPEWDAAVVRAAGFVTLAEIALTAQVPDTPASAMQPNRTGPRRTDSHATGRTDRNTAGRTDGNTAGRTDGRAVGQPSQPPPTIMGA
ncbi:hypothetical protein M6D93_01685 [Jatrophihabitans telluris]|uniref:Fungal lipase-like domain-containing protein n=1 Tax=Jatrophihabitans telluris TaxID=2038343 RepID=A0ABY4R0S7_9ACTN|nr:hypothetical protein [Jatrophihabitans telluris]UQX88726.1 hypothetical protein M6D93_01685 [Jatrophihabitans telluris]